MSSNVHRRIFSVATFECILTAFLAGLVQSQVPQHSPDSASNSEAQAALSRIVAGILSDTSSHMRMGPTRAATAADSARAAGIVTAARSALSQYADVKLAERDGYHRNMPWLEEQPIYHYNSEPRFKAASQGAFDVTKPVSLLYKKDDAGQLRLVGAMYAAGESAGPESLDALLPISMAHWHEHVNLCYPAGLAGGDGPPRIDARTVFMVDLFFSITSPGRCESAGGHFVPVDGGWAAHVYLFAGSDDPAVIWGTNDAGNMDVQMRHP